MVEIDRDRVVEYDENAIVQNYKGGHLSCKKNIVVQKKANNSGICSRCHKVNMNELRSDTTREKYYTKQVACNSRTKWSSMTPK